MLKLKCLEGLEKDLIKEIETYSVVKCFSSKEYIVQQGQIVRFLPIVIKGSIRVFSNEESVQFLLYYISSGETCIFSFAHLFDQEKVNFSALAEVDSELLLLPIDKVQTWYMQYPRFSKMLLKTYQKHYRELLETTKQIVCYNLEERLIDFLKKKSSIEKSNTFRISHQEIANNLGSSREVITRLMIKLNRNKKIIQLGRSIKLL